jgi:nucleotide-binding universal stress UspA family protein
MHAPGADSRNARLLADFRTWCRRTGIPPESPATAIRQRCTPCGRPRKDAAMISVSRILCPIDMSETSARALRHAVALGRSHHARVSALFVRPLAMTPMPWLDYPEAPRLTSAAEWAAADVAVLEFVGRAALDQQIDVHIREGVIVAEILKYAREIDAGLIVMGTHGLSGFERAVLGSVTEKILRKAHCPVLTVPPHEAPEREAQAAFRRILCATDFSPAASRAVALAVSLAQDSAGRLLLQHVLEGLPEEEPRLSRHFDVAAFRRMREEEARAQLATLVPYEGAAAWTLETIVSSGKPYREILHVAAERGVDLIVLGVQGRGPIDLALFGSTTHQVLLRAECPVLTAGPSARISSPEQPRAEVTTT